MYYTTHRGIIVLVKEIAQFPTGGRWNFERVMDDNDQEFRVTGSNKSKVGPKLSKSSSIWCVRRILVSAHHLDHET